MKRIHVHKMLHVSEIKMLDGQLGMICGDVEDWQFAEEKKSDESSYFPESDLNFEKAKLVFANFDNNKEVSVSLKPDLLSQRKIVVEDWGIFCGKNKEKLNRGNINIVLRGWKNDVCYNYLLGGRGNVKNFSISWNEEENPFWKLCLARVMQDNEHWALQYATGKQRLEIGVANNFLRRKYLNVVKVYVENGIHIALTDESKNDIKDVLVDFLAWDEGSGEFYPVSGKYQFDLNEIVLDVPCLYRECTRNFRLFLFTDNNCYYELKSAEKLSKEEKQDKSRRVLAALNMKDENRDAALVVSFTSGGYLHFTTAEQRNIFTDMCKPQAKSISIVNDKIKFVCRMSNSKLSMKSISLILRSKIQKKQYDFQFTKKERGNYVDLIAYLPLSQVEWEQFYWDIRGVVSYCGIESEVRFKNHSRIKHLCMLLKNQQTFIKDKTYVIYPYLTKSHDFSMVYRARTKEDCWQFVYKEYLALFLYYLLRPYWISRKIWLVYEKYSITAQDNSFYFFKYCMEKLSAAEKRNIYYVIDKTSSDYQYVSQYGGHVIQFLSLKHMIYLKAAHLLISSDTKAHAYAWRSPNTIYREMLKRNRNVFLQHGVIYYKKCHQGLKKSGTNSCRLFIVSSEVEKQIIKDYFGYKDSEIAVTGLARWDVLHDTSIPGEKMILMMPTWRNWLEEVSEEDFQKSDYYKNYMALLNNSKLHDFLERKNVNMVFYIHPKFREYIRVFGSSSTHIKMIEFGTQPLNELIMKCNMMVTDYSSACWDVYYQGKPVLFYLFDYELYSRVQGAYVDMRTEAFGEATDDLNELIRMMETIEENGFKEELKYSVMRERLLPYRDDCNSERTYQILKSKFAK